MAYSEQGKDNSQCKCGEGRICSAPSAPGPRTGALPEPEAQPRA